MRTSFDIQAIWSSSSVLLSIMSVRAPPSMNSMTTQSSFPRTRYEFKKLTMFGWQLSFITIISFTMSSLRGWVVRSISLIATFFPVASVLAT